MTPGLAKPVEPAALRAQTDAEARRDTGAQAGFSGRVKDWWQDFSRDALSQHQEGMRLTAKGEDGVLRPCCAFVKPLQLGRLVAAVQCWAARAWRLCNLALLKRSCVHMQLSNPVSVWLAYSANRPC